MHAGKSLPLHTLSQSAIFTRWKTETTDNNVEITQRKKARRRKRDIQSRLSNKPVESTKSWARFITPNANKISTDNKTFSYIYTVYLSFTKSNEKNEKREIKAYTNNIIYT